MALALPSLGETALDVVQVGRKFEPTVAALDLWHLPSSHRQGPTFLNIARVLDTPQAVALVLPRKVTLHVRDDAGRADWDWPLRLDAAAGGKSLRVKVVGD